MSRRRVAEMVGSLDWPGRAPADPGRLDDALAALAPGPRRWAVGAVEEALDGMRAQPDADLLAPWEEIRAFAQHVLAAILTGEGEPELEAVVDPRVVGDIVARDVHLPGVTDTMRTVQRSWLRRLLAAGSDAGLDADELAELATRAARVLDRWVDAMHAAVLSERWRRVDSAQARARWAVESLIDGTLTDEDAADAALGVRTGAWHLGCVIGSPGVVEIERRLVDAAASAFARAAGRGAITRHDTTTGRVWLWSTAEDPPGPVDDLDLPAPLVAGLGVARAGIAGFRRTHLDARRALDVALLAADPRTSAHRDTALAGLLAQDEERARWFVDDELGPLAADTAEAAELRHTLTVFFATRMRIAPAADALFVHRNTLINRLDRIESMLGHTVAARPAETQSALVLAELRLGGCG
jgi:hypothetical protein